MNGSSRERERERGGGNTDALIDTNFMFDFNLLYVQNSVLYYVCIVHGPLQSPVAKMRSKMLYVKYAYSIMTKAKQNGQKKGL